MPYEIFFLTYVPNPCKMSNWRWERANLPCKNVTGETPSNVTTSCHEYLQNIIFADSGAAVFSCWLIRTHQMNSGDIYCSGLSFSSPSVMCNTLPDSLFWGTIQCGCTEVCYLGNFFQADSLKNSCHTACASLLTHKNSTHCTWPEETNKKNSQIKKNCLITFCTPPLLQFFA